MAFVYLAYARKDGTRLAQRLNDGLKSAGFQPWFDRERLDPGIEWRKTIDDAIRDALAVVFIITPESVRSEFILKVYLEAFKRYNKQIFPVLGGDVRESDMPDLIRNHQWIDFREDFDKSFSRLVAVLHRLDDGSRLEEKGSVYVDVQSGDGGTVTEEQPVIETVLEDTESAYTPSEFTENSQTVEGESATAEGTATDGKPEPIPPEPINGETSVTLDPVSVKAAGTVTPPLKSRVDPATLIHVLTDSPTTADALGFKDYVSALAEIIRNQRDKDKAAKQKQHKEEPTAQTEAISNQPGKKDGQGQPQEKLPENKKKTEIPGKPLTIAIDAPWGTGKTSLMYMLEEELQNDPEHYYIPVWFNAWKYDQEESLWAALVLEILKEGKKQRGRRLRLWWSSIDKPKILAEAYRWLLYTAVATVIGYIILWLVANGGQDLLDPNVIGDLPLVKFILIALLVLVSHSFQFVATLLMVVMVTVIGRQFFQRFLKFDLNIIQYIKQPNYNERVGFLGQFDRDFRRIVRAITHDGDHPLAIFIDDLDRCEPPKSVEIIEAINILIDAQYCVYIIGMDSRGVAASIENKYAALKGFYEDDPGGLTLGQQFLEKIVQINFRIPPITKEIIDEYIERLQPDGSKYEADSARSFILRAKGLWDKQVGKRLTSLRKWSGAQIKKRRPASQPGDTPPPQPIHHPVTDEQPPRPPDSLEKIGFDNMPAVQNATLEATRIMNYNPRKIKQFLNEYRLQARIAYYRGLIAIDGEAKEGKVNLHLLGRWTVISIRWPDVIVILLEQPTFASELLKAHQLRKKCQKLQAQPAPDDDALKKAKAELSAALRQTNIKRFIDAAELIELLRSMGRSALTDNQVKFYLHLPKSAANKP